MRTVLLATGLLPDMGPLLNYRPSPLLNIADKPIIFYIIEALSRQGVKQLDLVVSHLPEQIEEKLEEGMRWGISINYHLAKDPDAPFAALVPVARGWADATVLLGLGDTLPQFADLNILDASPPVLFNDKQGEWTGWGLFSAESLSHLPLNATTDQLPTLIPPNKVITLSTFFSVRGMRQLKETNIAALAEGPQNMHLPTTARKVEPGVWISRAVTLEPEVVITPPVFIGEHTQIKYGAKIGPNAIIENNCIIDSRSSIEDSLVCQRSYIGENLALQNCVVDRNSLTNLTLGTHLQIQEDFILSDAIPPPLHRHLWRFGEKIFALCLLVLLSPCYLIMRALYPLKKETRLLLPAEEDRKRWQTFEQLTFDTPPPALFRRLPTLINIIMGEISFVGLPTRTCTEVERLPEEWRKLYLKSQAGIITLCNLEHGPAPSIDDQYADEAFYAATRRIRLDIKLIFKWLWKKIRGK